VRKFFRCMKNRQLNQSVFACVMMTLLATSVVYAQGTETKGPPKPVETTLTAQGGWPISITYYESSNAADSPVVVLLHGKGGNKRVWDHQFAPILQQNGYAVVSVDFRKHGKSVPATTDADGGKGQKVDATKLSALDYKAMVALDMEAVWKFLYEEHQKKHLNMQKTAIIASDMSVPLALNYAVYDWSKIPYDDAPVLAAKTPKGQTVRALILISPVASVTGVSSARPTVTLKEPLFGISFYVCAGAGDSLDRGAANKLFTQLSSVQDAKERMYVKEYPGKLRGTDMLGKRLGLELDIMKFLDKHLKKLPGDWSDRRPRYDREE